VGLPKDLNEEHQNHEEAEMMQGLQYLGYDLNLEDMKDCKDPFKTIEDMLIQIRRMCQQSFNYGNVLVLVYVTGHGYADKAKRTHILLNHELSFSPPEFSSRRYTNPYPIEKQLLQLFDNFSNLSIELVVDACREHLKFIKSSRDWECLSL
jgi:hypothetical protein